MTPGEDATRRTAASGSPALRPAALVLAVLAAACSSLRSPAGGEEPAELREAELGDLSSVAVCGDVWIAETPDAEHLDIARRRGIRTVVGLVPPGSPEAAALARACEREGMRYVQVDAAGAVPEADAVDRVLAVLEEPDRGPTLIHSPSGSLAAAVFAIWRVVHEGRPLEPTLQAARGVGMKPGEQEEAVRRHVERLRTAAAPAPADA